MHKLVLLVSTAAILAGCATSHDLPAADTGSDAIPLNAASAIAGDMAGRLAEQIGPAHVPISVEDGANGQALVIQAALKGWGYTIATGKPDAKHEAPIKLVYAIGKIEGQVLARISTPTIALARAYTVTADGALPVSPLSVRRLN